MSAKQSGCGFKPEQTARERTAGSALAEQIKKAAWWGRLFVCRQHMHYICIGLPVTALAASFTASLWGDEHGT